MSGRFVRGWLRWLIVIAGIIVLVGSLALNIYLYAQARNYYSRLNDLHLDPLKLDAFADQPLPTDTSRPILVFFGDSRAQNWPAPDGLESFTIINRGIGTQTSAQVALRFDAHVRPLAPDVLLVQMCINDLKTIPLFPDFEIGIIKVCKGNLDFIVNSAREMGTTVILTTVFPVGVPPVERWPVWSDAIAQAVETVNDYIRSLAAEDVLIFDSYALLAGPDGLIQPAYAADELHLNAVGYNLLNTNLVALLQTIQNQ